MKSITGTKWTVVNVVIILLGAVATIFAIDSRYPTIRELNIALTAIREDISELKGAVKDSAQTQKEILEQLRERNRR